MPAATASRPARPPVSVDELRSNAQARKLIEKLGLDGPNTNGRLSAFLSSLHRSGGDRREWPLDTLPGVVRYLAEMEEAVRLNRRVDQAFTYKGKTWLPAPLLDGQGQDKTVLLDWHDAGCIWLGRAKLKAFRNRKVLALCERADGVKSFRWTWFYSQEQWEQIKAARLAGTPPKAVAAAAAAQPSRRKPDTIGPDWIDTEETMRITRIKSRVTLNRARTIVGDRQPPGVKAWASQSGRKKKHGFKCGAKFLPLHAKVVMVEQSLYRRDAGTTVVRTAPEVRYYKPHAEAIGKEQWEYEARPDDVHIDDKGRRFLYAQGVRRKYGWSDAVLTKWRVDECKWLRRKIEAVRVTGRYSNRAEEWVYLEKDLDDIKTAIGGMKWGRAAKGKLSSRPRGPNGWLLPFPPPAPAAKPAEGTNGSGQAVHAGDVNGQGKKRNRGNQSMPDAERRELHRIALEYTAWRSAEGKSVRHPEQVYEQARELAPGKVGYARSVYRNDKSRGQPILWPAS